MNWRLVRKDVLGLSEFTWNEQTRRDLGLSKGQSAALEAGGVVHKRTARGSTTFYLLADDADTVQPQVDCPMCGGSGHVDRRRVYGA